MDSNKLTYILRIVGAGVFIIGVYKAMTAIWIIGLVVMLSGNIIRLIKKKKELKRNQ